MCCRNNFVLQLIKLLLPGFPGIHAAHVAGVQPAIRRQRGGGGFRIVDIAQEGLRTSETDVADFPGGHLGASRSIAVHRSPDRHGVGRHGPADAAGEGFGVVGESGVGAEAGGFGEAQAGRDSGRHFEHFVQERPWDGLPAVDGRSKGGEIAPAVIRRAPLHLDLGGNAVEFQAGLGAGQRIQRAQAVLVLGICGHLGGQQLHQLRRALKGVQRKDAILVGQLQSLGYLGHAGLLLVALGGLFLVDLLGLLHGRRRSLPQ